MSEPPLGPVPTITHPDQIVRPIDNYLPGEEQVIGLTTAFYDLLNQCFHAHGITGTAVLFDDPSVLPVMVHQWAQDRVRLTNLYGAFDPDNAGVRGYRSGNGLPAMMSSQWPDDAGATGGACEQAVVSVAPGGVALGSGLMTQQQLPDGGPVVNPDDSRYVPIVA